MIKQVFELPDGKTFENFDKAKAHMLDLLSNEIGKIIDNHTSTTIVSGNLTKQRLAIFDMLTTNNKKLVALMQQYAELEAQERPDDD